MLVFKTTQLYFSLSGSVFVTVTCRKHLTKVALNWYNVINMYNDEEEPLPKITHPRLGFFRFDKSLSWEMKRVKWGSR